MIVWDMNISLIISLNLNYLMRVCDQNSTVDESFGWKRGTTRLEAQIHQTDIKEPTAMEAERCVGSHRRCPC